MEPRYRDGSTALSRSALLAAIAIALGFCCGGCLALAVPEVAYEGYKYEHKKDSKPKDSKSAPSPNEPSPRTPDDSIE